MFRPEKQVPIGLIVGLGAAASAALAAFYVLSKKDDESFELDSKLEAATSIKSSFQSTRSTVINKIIPKEAIGAVIGKGGENIRLIQRKTNTKITCANEDPLNEDEDRTLAIKGTHHGALAADELIDSIIEKSMACILHKIYISSNDVGLVIGKSGSTIKTISEESGAKVSIPKNIKGGNNHKIAIEIRGEPVSVQTAVKLINAKLKINKGIRPLSHAPVENYVNGRNGQTNYINFIPTYLNISSISADKFERLESNLENGCQDVYVASVQSPSKFWVQPCGNISADLDRLMIDMTDYYEKTENQMHSRLNQYNVGDIVAAPLKGDEHWFRVMIMDYDDSRSRPGEGEVTVYYLDFGDQSIVLAEEICSLHEEFLNRLTFQAIECSLFGVEPISESGNWSEDAVDYFKKTTRTSLWEKVFVKTHKVINMKDEPREHYVIEIFALQNSFDINIAECLIEKGFAGSSTDN